MFRFGDTIPLESMWSMDARADGTFLTGTITDKVSKHGAPYATSVIGGSGILQNLYAQIGDSPGGNVDAPAAPYYARRHDIAGNIRSVVGPGRGLRYLRQGLATPVYLLWQLDVLSLVIKCLGGQALWEAGTQNNRTPWYNSYDDYVSQMRLKGKDYSIVPEFRISDHVETYVKTYGGDFLADNLNILEMSGGIEDKNASNEEGFYKTYTNSDFLKFFEIVRDDHAGTANPANLGLRCKGLLKFLPYNGFLSLREDSRASQHVLRFLWKLCQLICRRLLVASNNILKRCFRCLCKPCVFTRIAVQHNKIRYCGRLSYFYSEYGYNRRTW